ncbi:MAG: NADPH:quinone oxidoreductase family protein [Acidimicrobiia bacterium]|nr:MAG: NADPH:quinone oxidoreductase family protein [Acidimicrobiia bacterium]
MRAVLCTEFGEPESLIVSDVPDPEPGSGEVVVDVAAAGVNYPDTLTIRDMYQFKPSLPFSPGGELAGVVSAVGEGVAHLSEGDRVIALTGASGAFAEKAVADARRTIPVPDGMPLDLAAAFVFTYGTSYHALVDRADPVEGETLLVLGAAGGVGLAAVEIGAALGLRVVAAASTDEKLAVCRERGAQETINYATEDLKDRMKELGGADIVYDPVGGDYAEAALRATNWLGRYLVVGFPAGIPKFPLNLVLLKGCDVRGVFWGESTIRNADKFRAGLQQLAVWFADGTVRPHISGRYALEEASEAIRAMMDRMAVGKLLVEVNPDLV